MQGRVKIPPSFDGAKQKSTSQTEPEEKAARTCRALTSHHKLVLLYLHIIYTRHLLPGLLCPVTVSGCPLGHVTSLTPVSCDSQPVSTGSCHLPDSCVLWQSASVHWVMPPPWLMCPVTVSQCQLGHATSLTTVSYDSQPASTGSRHLLDSCVPWQSASVHWVTPPPWLLCPVTVSQCPLGHATSLTTVSYNNVHWVTPPPWLLCPVTVSQCPLGHATSLTPVSCDSQPMSTGSRHLPDYCVL